MTTFFHTSPLDLSGEELLLPPSRTGREPSWEGMADSERDQVFMSTSLDDAWAWAEDLYDPATGSTYIFEVEPVDVEVRGFVAVAPWARIVRRVHPAPGTTTPPAQL